MYDTISCNATRAFVPDVAEAIAAAAIGDTPNGDWTVPERLVTATFTEKVELRKRCCCCTSLPCLALRSRCSCMVGGGFDKNTPNVSAARVLLARALCLCV